MESLTTMERQTERFIHENPTDVVFTRTVRTPDGAGGFTAGSPTTLDPQTVRVVPQRSVVNTERRNAAGEVVSPSIILVCMSKVNLMRGDTFTWTGLPAEVVWIVDLGYVKHAEVVT